MTLQEQAIALQSKFLIKNAETNISHYGFIKKQLWDMQVRLIEEESQEFIEAAGECLRRP